VLNWLSTGTTLPLRRLAGIGRTIAQVVSRRLPTAAARVRARVSLCGIYGGQSGTGTAFFEVLRIPLQIFIPPLAPQLSLAIIWGWYNRPVVAAVPNSLSLPHEEKEKHEDCDHEL
jgi:hypothetical protein